MARVFVLGHKGMLGHVVCRYLKEQGHHVFTSEKRFELGPNPALFTDIFQTDSDVIINCIGKIRQKGQDPTESYAVNSLLPIQLSQRLNHSQCMIQISTDCVFSGKSKHGYTVHDQPDPEDIYGSSKAIAEIVSTNKNVAVIRTSIIGPEISTSFGLMSWFLNNPNSIVQGYQNHFWNGVTTLELAKLLEAIVSRPYNFTGKITHVVSVDSMSKANLLYAINEVFDCKKTILPTQHSETINRVLRPAPGETCKYLYSQLVELKEWYYK